MKSEPRFVIHTPDFNEDVGGVILLHKLCYMLNDLGYQAVLWPGDQRPVSKYLRFLNRDRALVLSKDYPAQVIKSHELAEHDIVIYPEVVRGNPLKHPHVVRWFLHKPGYHTGEIDYGKDELYFFFDSHSDDPSINTNPDNKLSLLAIHPAYVNRGEDRSGSCYLVRKGKGKQLVHDLDGSLKIDGLNHEEIANIFNRASVFYSYDEMTMYSQFAALCGCVSVVIPESYKCREDWVAKHPISRYGIAYGLDDIDHAIQTQHKVREFFKRQEEISIQEIHQFVKKTILFFEF